MTDILPNQGSIDRELLARVELDLFSNFIEQAATSLGGARVAYYNQIHTDPAIGMKWKYGENGGVCQSLCLHWIAYHATDRDFWKWLRNAGNEVNSTAAHWTLKIQLEHEGSRIKPRHAEQFLKRFGIVPQRKVTGENELLNISQSDHHEQTWARLLDDRDPIPFKNLLANAVVPEKSQGSYSYQLVGLSKGGGTGHAVAAFIAEDGLFFDPNYGEFWFPKKEFLRLWLPIFMDASKYSEKYDYVRVDSYGKGWNAR